MHQLFGQTLYPLGIEHAVEAVLHAATHDGRAYGCLTNVHMIVEQGRDHELSAAMRAARWNFPDGRPVALALRLHGEDEAEQIAGPALMERCCREAMARGVPVYFHGGTPEVLDRLTAVLRKHYPELVIAGAYSPPFAPLEESTMAEEAARIVDSGARITFVGLGCPKQELWMHANRHRVPGAMLGVGAAFAMHAGLIPRAPSWMAVCYLEWLYRLGQEPRRLWRRYAGTNPVFVYRLARSLVATRLASGWRPGVH